MESQTPMEIECAHCGNKNLQQIPGVWTPIPMNESGLIQGPAIPMVVVGCPQCGFVSMFSPQALKPQPFPEPPAQPEQGESK
ncbi:MAG: hypothetical protein ACM3XM_20940 [Mycobacterium leprae]